MFRLLFKDYKISKGFFVTSIILSIALGMVNGFFISYELLPLNIAFIFFISYIIPTINDNIDEKYNCNQFLVSLPIKRAEVVITKYISGIIIPLITFLVIFIGDFAVNFFMNKGDKVLPIYILLIVLVINMILFSIYYPIGFKYSHQKANMVRSILMFSIILLPSILVKFYNINERLMVKISTLFTRNINLTLNLFFIFSLIIFILSMLLSISIYKNKEI